MTSCTIIVYHYEGLEFLKACLRKVRQYERSDIEQKIIIAEQSSPETYNKVLAEFGKDSDVTIVRMQPLWSGYAIDYLMRYGNIKTEYVCCIEPDVFAINSNYLYLCIKLLEEFNFKFVGGLITVTKPEDSIYYYKNSFYWLSQYLRVGRTEDYRELALQGGFTRFHNRNTEHHNKIEMDKPMTWGNDDWEKWAAEDYYWRGSDDATIAHCWEDNYKQNNKFSFGVSHMIGEPLVESGYGRIIDDIVFHFGFHRTSVGLENEMGEKYMEWKSKIAKGLSDELIQEMLDAAKPISEGTDWHNIPTVTGRSMWDGTLKKIVTIPDELNKRIEELKK